MRSRDREEGILADELRRCLAELVAGSGYDRQDEIRAALRAAGWPDSPWNFAGDTAVRAPAVGTRVVFDREFGDFPLAPMPAGTSGEVTAVSSNHCPYIEVRLDQHQEQLRGWDNVYYFEGGPGQDLAGALAEYGEACREVYVPRRIG